MELGPQSDGINLHPPVVIEHGNKFRVSLVEILLSASTLRERHAGELVLSNDFIKLFEQILIELVEMMSL